MQQRRPPIKSEKKADSESSDVTYYVIAESPHSTTKMHRGQGSFGTTRHILDPSTTGPFYYSTTNSKQTTSPDALLDIRTRPSTIFKKNASSFSTSYGTTNYEFKHTNYKRPFLTTNVPKNSDATTKLVDSIALHEPTTPKQVRSSDYEDISEDVILSFVDSLFDNEINKEEDLQNKTDDIDNNTTTEFTTTKLQNVSTANNLINLTITTFLNDFSTTTEMEELNTTTLLSLTTEMESTESTYTTDTTLNAKVSINSTTSTTLVTTTDCIRVNNSNISTIHKPQDNVEERNDLLHLSPTEFNNELIPNTIEPTHSTTESLNNETTTVITTTVKDITEVDLESKVKVDAITPHPLSKISPDIETLLNISINKNKNKDYEDYDYNEPTLPPSLPNLR